MKTSLALHEFFIDFDGDRLFDQLDVFYTPKIDLCIILALIRRFTPQTFLEIGTNIGHTSRLIKSKFPHLAITTIDPGDKVAVVDRPESQKEEYVSQDAIGSLLKGYTDVNIIRERFEDVYFENSKFDFIFLDGNHIREEVIKDTLKAMSLVQKGGLIIWHDVNNCNAPGVSEALLNFDKLKIVNPIGTWIGFCHFPQ